MIAQDQIGIGAVDDTNTFATGALGYSSDNDTITRDITGTLFAPTQAGSIWMTASRINILHNTSLLTDALNQPGSIDLTASSKITLRDTQLA
ncbi:MAG: hypothetical protein GWN10_23475, partial [Nitrospinaceae bacterium]|nr:hypothetical protein [Nitrospinaceae bacterium]